MTYAIPDLHEHRTPMERAYELRWRPIERITSSAYLAAQLTLPGDEEPGKWKKENCNWFQIDPVMTKDLPEKNLETQENAVKMLIECIEQNSMSGILAARLLTALNTSEVWLTSPDFEKHRRHCAQLPELRENFPTFLPVDFDQHQAPPTAITIAIPQDNFIDVALQYARSRDLITGRINTRYTQAYKEFMLATRTAPNPKSTASRGVVRADRKSESAVCAVTRRYLPQHSMKGVQPDKQQEPTN